MKQKNLALSVGIEKGIPGSWKKAFSLFIDFLVKKTRGKENREELLIEATEENCLEETLRFLEYFEK